MSQTNEVEPGTMSSACYQRLRSDIRAGRFKPGEPLRVSALTQEFQIGHSPVREALNRLAADGIITQSDQRGFRIPPASVDELLELTRTRCIVAEITLRDSIERGGQKWEEQLVLAHFRISRKRYGEGADYEDRHADFHRALTSACPSPWLLDFSDKLYEVAARYRALAISVLEGSNLADTAIAEHDQLFEAALARDIETTIRIHNAHVRRASEAILATEALFQQGLIQGDWPGEQRTETSLPRKESRRAIKPR